MLLGVYEAVINDDMTIDVPDDWKKDISEDIEISGGTYKDGKIIINEGLFSPGPVVLTGMLDGIEISNKPSELSESDKTMLSEMLEELL